MTTQTDTTLFISAGDFLTHWQGHRALTRRMIEAFPEEAFLTYSIGGMRPFAALVGEMLGMAVPTAKGVATGDWGEWTAPPELTSKADALARWDADTSALDAVWPTIPPHRFLEVDKAFGMWEGPGYWILQYCVDNEIHHRGQGYVYLRALGIEPPFFYER